MPQVSDIADISKHNVLQRIILPRDTDPLNARPLYLDEPDGVHSHISSRRCVTVPASASVSFASYFNAFPASYWRRWTRLNEVVLRMAVRGSGRIETFYSRWHGEIVYSDGQVVRSQRSWSYIEFRMSLAQFADGGWLWFDVYTEDATLEIADAAWTTDEELPAARLAIGTTTFNRPNDCVAALAAIGEDEAVLSLVDKVFVADQGTNTVRSHPRFAEVSALLGERLQVIEQQNLGGSGGFTRAFYETLEHTDAEQVLLLDDDILLEPDSILRANAFARAATDPVIVGGQMLNLQARARLHSMGETVDLHRAEWGPAPGAVIQHDFGAISLRKHDMLHRRIDATYNGWWMCLFPRKVVLETGLPLPLFIKWDDAEYALRALERGFPTVTLPGAGVWHMPWTDKNDNFDWTLYFHRRNRLVTAALHSPHDPRKALIKQGLRDAFRRLLSMEYSSVAVELKAVEDFLAGPGRLFETLGTSLGEVQRLRARYPDSKLRASAQDFPLPTTDLAQAERMLRPPVHPAKIAIRATRAFLHNLREPDPRSVQRPQMNVPTEKALWFLLGNLDSATVTLPDGGSVSFRRRDPKVFRALGLRVFRDYWRLARKWSAMKQAYRAALPELTSIDAWRKVYQR
ncbi:MAG: glycosyltransferase [Sciscionella sp.]